MTLPARGFRGIRVDGSDYVWRVRFTKCLCCHARAVVIADASRRGSVVHLPGPVAELPETQAAILPALIAERIREARLRGWVPGEGRGVFVQLAGAPA
jgi:hypothetical protein